MKVLLDLKVQVENKDHREELDNVVPKEKLVNLALRGRMGQEETQGHKDVVALMENKVPEEKRVLVDVPVPLELRDRQVIKVAKVIKDQLDKEVQMANKAVLVVKAQQENAESLG